MWIFLARVQLVKERYVERGNLTRALRSSSEEGEVYGQQSDTDSDGIEGKLDPFMGCIICNRNRAGGTTSK